MSRYRIAFLILIGSLFFLGSCTHGLLLQVKKQNYTNLPCMVCSSRSPIKLKTELHVYDVSLTGIMVVKKGTDGALLVSFVNEFGLKYFDAILKGSDTQMLYCIKQLDKKILTNVLLHDLSVLFLSSVNHEVSNAKFQLGKYTYNYSMKEDGTKQINEYNRKEIISVFLYKKGGTFEVTHTNMKISMNLKPI